MVGTLLMMVIELDADAHIDDLRLMNDADEIAPYGTRMNRRMLARSTLLPCAPVQPPPIPHADTQRGYIIMPAHGSYLSTHDGPRSPQLYRGAEESPSWRGASVRSTLHIRQYDDIPKALRIKV